MVQWQKLKELKQMQQGGAFAEFWEFTLDMKTSGNNVFFLHFPLVSFLSLLNLPFFHLPRVSFLSFCIFALFSRQACLTTDVTSVKSDLRGGNAKCVKNWNTELICSINENANLEYLINIYL